LLADCRDKDAEAQLPLWLPEGHTAIRAGGETFPIEASLSCTQAGDQTLFTLILRDVKERKQAEAEQRRLQGLNRYLQQELDSAQGAGVLVGADQGLRPLMEQVRQVAATDATVLIVGETGTGKELIARAVHAQGPRREQPLVTLNCAAIPEGLVESELFGHEKGAFTGALTRKIGRFELADRGTLFLDEIGELSVDLQAKLLRVLQEGELERLGSTRTLKVDVRIVAATNRDLDRQVAEGQFRADLYYRLNVFPLSMPPLRERREDIPLLADHFVRIYANKYRKPIDHVPEPAMDSLQQYDWPGNVRELQHLIERAVIMSPGPMLVLNEPLKQAPASVQSKGAGTLEEVERAHILEVLEQSKWRVSGTGGAAERLGLKPTTLESRMKKLGISRPDP
jgi:transcriptional regulator with GAF, ATPase, and Fis domain